MSTSGRNLLSALIEDGDIHGYVKMGLDDSLFKEGELVLFKAIQAHVQKYGKIPSRTTIENKKGLEDAVVDVTEPAQFYYDEVKKRYLHTMLKAGVQEISALLVEKNADEALDVFLRITMDAYKRKNSQHIADFREAQELIYQAYVKQKSLSSMVSMPYGWSTLDEMSGGARGGDFNTIVGRPMMGKTMLMLYGARHSWRAGRRPLFASLEMSTLTINQRLAAMDTQTKLTQIMKAELSTKVFNEMMDKLHALQDEHQPLWVVDSEVVSTVDDIILQCQILQPTDLWVDAAYLLKHPNQRMGKFEKQSENAERIKRQVSASFDIPTTASYQLSKESAKAKKKDKNMENSMEDVYGSDAMAQLSSLMMGLFQQETDIEAANKRYVQILKGRNGERGGFTINWDFSKKMDFSEIEKEDPSKMQLTHMG